MNLFDEQNLTALDRKAKAVLGDHVVLKSLCQEAAFHRIPRFVTEYLIAKYVKPATWQEDLEKIRTRVKETLPSTEQTELLKHQLWKNGELTLIDFVEARIDLKNQQRWARVPAIHDDRVRVSEGLLEQHTGMMLGGLWGTVKLRFCPEVDADAPIELIAFTPFQIGSPDMQEWKAKRSEFTTDEWMDLMLNSAGYEASAFPSRRVRLLLLARLIPLVERNVNLVELGPRQTGKTFLLRNISPRVFVLSGGKTTPANLFYNLSTKAVGILGNRKVVVFDEIAHTSFQDEDATLSTLKDYMESGSFSRGSKSFTSDASLVLTGNLDVDGNKPHPRYQHLFEALPDELIDSAFLDRIHGYLPGWEFPKITPSGLSKGYGFVSDYFGEVLSRLRDEDFQPIVRRLPLANNLTKRDQAAVERLGSGMLKMLYPDGQVTDQELAEVGTLACELRQRVHRQLCEIAPGEFKDKTIAFTGMGPLEAVDLQSKAAADIPAEDALNRDAKVGAVTGLGVVYRDNKAVGGDVIIIQVAAINGATGLEVTGLHGQILKDSVQTAYNIVRRNAVAFSISEKRFKEQKVAVHLVRIASPKEGPSAGLAFVVGICSALSGRPVKPACAMTGEVTLFGEVKSVGGIEHKLRAAVKAGRKEVFIPAENASEMAQLEAELLSNLKVYPVSTVQEVLEKVLIDPGSSIESSQEVDA